MTCFETKMYASAMMVSDGGCIMFVAVQAGVGVGNGRRGKQRDKK